MVKDRILICDSETKTTSLLRQILTDAGFEVLTASKGDRAIQMAALEHPLMILVEIDLSGDIDGFEVIDRVREFSDIPVIVLSSRTSPNDILNGYDHGVDDYVTKPFNARILLARIQAVLKRVQSFPAIRTESEISVDDLVINLQRREVLKGGIQVHLTQTEYNLLLELVKHSNRVLLHEQLLSAVWGDQFQNEVDYLRSYVHILRRKLECNPAQPRIIISKPGVGYMLVSDQL